MHAALEDWRHSGSLGRVATIAVLLFAIAARVAVLDQPMRYDETWMYLTYASRSLATVVGDYSFPNNHVFHTLLVWLSTRAFGNSPSAIRLPTLVAGILIVPATYAAARRLSSPRGALVAATLAAGWPILILYATNARGYSLIALASLILIVLAGELVTNDTPLRWIVFAAILAAGMFTVPIMIYSAGATMLWMIAEKARLSGREGIARFAARLMLATVLAAMLSVAAYGLIIERSGIAPLVSNRFVTPLAWPEFFRSLPIFVQSLRDVLGLGISLWLALLLAAAGIVSVLAPGPQRTRRLSLLIAIGVWSVVVLVATRRPPPPRVWLFIVPFACLFAGAGLDEIIRATSRAVRARERVLAAAAIALVAGALALQDFDRHVVRESEETDYYGLREAAGVARFLLPRLRAGDRVIAARTTGLPLDYYLLRLGGRRLEDFDSGTFGGRVFVVVNQRHGQRLSTMRGIRGDVPWDSLAPPREVWRLEGATVFETPAAESLETIALPHDR